MYTVCSILYCKFVSIFYVTSVCCTVSVPFHYTYHYDTIICLPFKPDKIPLGGVFWNLFQKDLMDLNLSVKAIILVKQVSV